MLPDIIIGILLGMVIFFAGSKIYKSKKNGGGCYACSNCPSHIKNKCNKR